MDAKTDKNAGQCPSPSVKRAQANRDWWPNQLDIQVLHRNSDLSDPMGAAFDYAKEFKSLDLNAVIKDLHALMTQSQDWWPNQLDIQVLHRNSDLSDPMGAAFDYAKELRWSTWMSS